MARQKNGLLIFSAGFVTLLVVLALAAPLISPHDPYSMDALARLKGPSAEHWLGTDQLGRDTFA
ncbi:ABC transporter permease, partial [Mycobacterium tuberculosis]|nr:ABC transporter permease [Mycobacterium tuberculosis]